MADKISEDNLRRVARQKFNSESINEIAIDYEKKIGQGMTPQKARQEILSCLRRKSEV